MRVHVRLRAAALRSARWQIVQMSVAAGLSWFVAHNLIGHTDTYFAPVASTIVLGVVPGERSRRAVEMVLGIALGTAIGDAIIQAIGRARSRSACVLLAVGAAIMLGGGRLIASQAAVWRC